MSEKGLLIVLSGPSGVGKGTVAKQLLERNHDTMCFSVSATTRLPREGEQHGREYYFLNKEEFLLKIEQKEMLEYASYCGNFYGTPRSSVEETLSLGIDVLLDIEVQGGEQVKDIYGDEAVSIFLIPTSICVLRKRLEKRGTETPESIAGRLETAEQELLRSLEYDYIVVNDELEICIGEVESILLAEKRKAKRLKNLLYEVIHNA